ncbi:MAG: 1-(5-phosphoribosyl)-5-[(5-phosphoribosylamino)methylideneamino]imidazole-4-carboxamide isomerase [Actinobacteria bacterium]|nr:1-(5-phosphoribosyl)-5-[(5-phosphoribosylamino)methylideneamino]imidazole-4-carboxamide isomerase [Actinomycetota bacterium]
MELYPAIDLRGGRCVRLYQGDFARETRYDADPVEQAQAFADAGAAWVHVVDLDAARTGDAVNRPVIAAIAAAAPLRVQAGGGVRDDASAEALLSAGVRRVVVGTAAVEHPEWAMDLAERHPGRVALGLDVRGREVAVRGWQEGSGRDVVELTVALEEAPFGALIVTEIGRDGTFAGPDLELYALLLESTELDVIASGGVGTSEHLRALAALEAGGRALEGAIVGRALYEGAIGIDDALAAAGAAPGP